MSISRAETEKVAVLARLQLSEGELDAMSHQLSRVLQYIDQLGELDVDGVEPLANATEIENVFRADEIQPSLNREAALGNAPKRDAECFLVPAVLGE